MNLPDPLHPVVVHFPIVLVLLGAVIGLVAVGLQRIWLARLTAVVLMFGAVGSLAATWSGEEDEDAAEHAGAAAEQVFEEHEEWGERTRNVAIVAALVAGFTAFAIHRLPKLARPSAAITAALALAATWCVIQTGHYGGLLVYRHGVGVSQSGQADSLKTVGGKKSRNRDDD